MDERLHWLAFSAFPGIGPVRFQALLKRFGTAKSAWKSSDNDLKEALGEKTAEKFDRFRHEFSVEGYAKKLKEKEVHFLTLEDKEYPPLLKEIKNSPFVLYSPVSNFPPVGAPLVSPGGTERVRAAGSPSTAATPRTIAVVGTRKITNYGREVTRMLVSELVANGFTIVSGLAIGIDSIAHETAIEVNGKTIAVLGCGVDCCYPATNQPLYNSILNGNGCIVSEFPLGVTPTKGSFPSRNRIIAGLSLGVLVTEGAEDSGALITADYCFKFNRKVFAVPGPITSGLSKGPHKLIEKGAKIVTSGADILKELQISNIKFQIKSKAQSSKREKGTKEEEMILKILANEELHIDEIVRRSGLSTSGVGSLLAVMEIKGMVREVGGGVFGIFID